MKEESFGLFPIRGLWIGLDEVSPLLLEREWAFVAPNDADSIASLVKDQDSLRGNVEMLRERLKPDAFLIVRRYLDFSDVRAAWLNVREQAQRIITALNLIFLRSPLYEIKLQNGSDGQRMHPHPIWLTEVPEHPELPLVFLRDRLLVSGHHQTLSWTSWQMLSGQRRSNADIDAAINAAPDIYKALLPGGNVQNSFESAARALMLSFNVASQGQFISSAVGSLDILFGENNSVRWSSMQDYVSTLCGSGSLPRVKSVFEGRHRFIHRHIEPTDPSSHLITVAVVAAAFIRWADMLARYKDRTASLDVLEAIGRLTRASRGNSAEVAAALAQISKMVALPQWIADWSL
ncbi:hypothetical protein [Mesorhizobium sp. B2-8-9]|uniref:hypothetical protein n=1 Tax=Mesorhizobium sp. B2-8-9 TaxID=2589899 RepID=UPI00112B0F8C|nr:hypothetical protein [Mesorhizobium sp. B2-8-9]TPI79516.1 hypothetical protein FJ423_15070 [Mesorhizobium sp. B2-8-9]